ncbi:MAG: HNH endonuclease [Microcoleaceae cyanobacterium]
MSDNQKSNIEKNLAYYCQLFTELKTNKNQKLGTAKHKPILLLSVIDLMTKGLINNNQITVSEELINIFNKNWEIMYSDSDKPAYYKRGLFYPFIHLESDNFWNVKFKPDFVNALPKKILTKQDRPKSLKRLKEVVEYASLDAELFELLQDQNYRKELTDTLVSAWFSANQRELADLIKINNSFQKKSEEEETSITTIATEYQRQKQPKSYLRKSVTRDAFFRKAVVQTYKYKCAFCGIKVTMSIHQNIVDGAHIKPFAKFYDNRIDNGISLCKNHHWAFDRGLFAIGDDYKIIVSKNFQAESPNSKPIRDFNGNQLWLPREKDSLNRSHTMASSQCVYFIKPQKNKLNIKFQEVFQYESSTKIVISK